MITLSPSQDSSPRSASGCRAPFPRPCSSVSLLLSHYLLVFHTAKAIRAEKGPGNTKADHGIHHPAIVATGLGAIPIGSSTAFLDLTGSFIILTTVSYAIPFMSNVLTRRRHFPKGPFHLGKYGDAINITAVVLITFFNIFYCFRELPPYHDLPCLHSSLESKVPQAGSAKEKKKR